jgi:delta-1-pyrroline-5-carboxylate synthetase
MTENANNDKSAIFNELPSRAALRGARRVCVKAGTSVVATDDGRPSLTRLGAIAEQISELVNSGIEVIFVSSGAVGMGKRLLRKQSKMLMSLKDNIVNSPKQGDNLVDDIDLSLGKGHRMERNKSFVSLLDVNKRPHTYQQKKRYYDSACAAAGQFDMMNFYQSLFVQCDVVASQLLVTQGDFTDPSRLNNLKYATERLLR